MKLVALVLLLAVASPSLSTIRDVGNEEDNTKEPKTPEQADGSQSQSPNSDVIEYEASPEEQPPPVVIEGRKFHFEKHPYLKRPRPHQALAKDKKEADRKMQEHNDKKRKEWEEKQKQREAEQKRAQEEEKKHKQQEQKNQTQPQNQTQTQNMNQTQTQSRAKRSLVLTRKMLHVLKEHGVFAKWKKKIYDLFKF